MKYFRRIISYLIEKSPKKKQFQKRIQYFFLDTYYLDKALTHRSVKNHYEGNYERLEFLGDAIIDHVVSHWLFTKYSKSDEGTLTKKRAALVNRDFLAMLGHKLKIIDMRVSQVNLSKTGRTVSKWRGYRRGETHHKTW